MTLSRSSTFARTFLYSVKGDQPMVAAFALDSEYLIGTFEIPLVRVARRVSFHLV